MIFRFWSTRYVQHLEAEIEHLRTQMLRERQRAEDAVSALLEMKARTTLRPRPLIADREKDATNQLEDLFKDPEFSRAGQE